MARGREFGVRAPGSALPGVPGTPGPGLPAWCLANANILGDKVLEGSLRPGKNPSAQAVHRPAHGQRTPNLRGRRAPTRRRQPAGPLRPDSAARRSGRARSLDRSRDRQGLPWPHRHGCCIAPSLVVSDCPFVRSIWLTLGRREAPAGKKRSGPGQPPQRCRKCLLGRELGVAGWQGCPVRPRTCVRNGPALCQEPWELNRTPPSEFQHRRTLATPSRPAIPATRPVPAATVPATREVSLPSMGVSDRFRA